MRLGLNPAIVIVLFIGLIFVSGCIDQSGAGITGGATAVSIEPESKYELLEDFSEFVNDSNKLVIGNFNIQVFGKTKAGKEEVMDVLDDILEDYDLVSIQEIRDKSNTAFPSLAERLPGQEYVISDRLGRSSSKEQYAYIYNPRKLTYVSSYVYDDPEDVFEREPFVAKFASGDLNFVIIQIHTKPKDAESEIANLEYVLEDAKQSFPGETEFIILGDLNADCSYYKKDELSELEWIVPETADTTTKSTDCAYDRIIVTEDLSDNILGYGIDRFDLEYNLSEEETTAVSDHYPIFAVLDLESS